MNTEIKINTARTLLAIPGLDDAALMLDYCVKNQRHMANWEPLREHNYYTLPYWQGLLTRSHKLCIRGTELRFAIFNKSRTEVIGVCHFSGISRGAFQACYLGYSVAEKHQGQGYMFEALSAAIDYVFHQQGLHRIMANYMPENQRSAQLLARLGFATEGLAKSYLKIAGVWQDHVLSARVNPSY
jgi:ribosomal-protein-alanine N-acetyltransferase